jgi:hypothetical protein
MIVDFSPGGRGMALVEQVKRDMARVSDAYRTLSIRQKNTFVWFCIGNHADYERLLKDEVESYRSRAFS